MGMTERLQIVATHNEPLNKHVIWLKGNVFRKWDGSGWEIIGGTGGGGTTDYNELINKPSINGITLKGNIKLNLEGYTKAEIDNKFNNLNIPDIDLKEYAKKSEIPSIKGLASETFVTTKIAEAQLGGSEVDLSDYATKLELQESIKSISIPSLSGYATELWVNSQGFIKTIPEDYAKKSDIPSLDGYATQQFVTDKINEAQLGDKDVDLSGYATEIWVNQQGFLKEVPSDYITKQELNSQGFVLSTELASYQRTITDLDTIRQGASKGATALQSIPSEIEQQIADKVDKNTLAPVATSGSYNDLSDKPTIPDTITENTVSEWGFTKNTGNYSKPSDGIPKNDLDNDVQLSLGKADTALQSYTEQYRGTVTGVRVNNSIKNSVSGIVDIGNVVTGVKINNFTKNPSSGIVDLGTVLTSHQDISGKQDRITIVDHGTSNTTFTMTPNVLHKWDTITSLTLTFPTSNNSYVDEYKAVFTAGTNFSMAVPDTMKWVNGQIPSFTEGIQYELSILDSRILICSF